MTHLLDTSVCCQPLKAAPRPEVLRRWDSLEAEAATAVTCLAEIEWGLHKLGSQRRWQQYHEVVVPSLRPILPDRETWSRWAALKARQHLLGRPIEDLDLLIAATAIQHGLILATLNSRHFAVIEGLLWEDWSA